LQVPSPADTGPERDVWQAGYGVIAHNASTRARVEALADRLVAAGHVGAQDEVYRILAAADRLASAAMWLVVHMTYARRVDPLGAPLAAADFKVTPEGHTGGSLNMVPAYVGYLAANALTGVTRSWIMGQGHCVAAIEAVNTLTGNLSPEQAGRYGRSEAGLSRLVSDFYSYAMDNAGRPSAPLGSHVGVHTAGGVSEGGYLGFAEVQYVHMPLPGETLVAFLSDGAFEEQRGADWTPRWWRAEDSGAVVPIMILNGRRIEQRTEISQEGGASWLEAHLAMNGFVPCEIDGRDPAAFACAILDSEAALMGFDPREAGYPAPLPYVVARTIKGFGFPGAGTNLAHNLPLPDNPHTNADARAAFNQGAGALFVPPDVLEAAVSAFNRHALQGRPLERDHPLATRRPPAPQLPVPAWTAPGAPPSSPMGALDAYFVDLVDANPELRVRVGNPDEMRSNQMGRALDRLKHRVNQPEAGTAESITGSVITALNEEAVAGAALGNKGGLNLIVSYEAFAVKMLGGLRQEIIFARRQKEVGRAPGWLGVPLILTSHTWENTKNEQSHQDPTLPEALLGEMSDAARVLFPVDANSTIEALRQVYGGRGLIGAIVAPKRAVPQALTGAQAARAFERGAIHLLGEADACDIQLVAVGAYQLQAALRAAERLRTWRDTVCVTAILEPGRLREPRDDIEAAFVLPDDAVEALFPTDGRRIIVSHTRPEPMMGLLRRLDSGRSRARALGYIGGGGTLDTFGMLFANRCSWAHVALEAARLLGVAPADLFSEPELEAVLGVGDPAALR
jgi:phosphoketolase